MKIDYLASPGNLDGLVDRLAAEGFTIAPAVRAAQARRDSIPNADDYRNRAFASVTEALAGHDGAPTVMEAAEALILAYAEPGIAAVREHARRATAHLILGQLDLDAAYSHVATRYNAAAAEIHAAIETVDPATDPQKLDAAELAAWQAVPGLARRLDALRALLTELYEASPSTPRAINAAGWGLGLIARPPAGADVATMRSAHLVWDGKGRGTGRGGLYAELVRLGATLTAPESVHAVAAWPDEPAPTREAVSPR